MQYRNLGSSGVKVSPICLGTMMFGAATDEATAGRIVAKAKEQGVNFIDSADAYAGGKLLNMLAKFGNWTIEIVRRMADTIGFEVLPRRWVVERTLAWLNRNRRLAKDFEATIASAKAWLYLASVQLLIRRLARA